VPPAAGRITRAFGAADGAATTKGVTFATRPGAEVVAPYAGEILFAGPFKGYGQILIIDHGGGYHSLLAGIDRIESGVGQWVATGEPVGRMRPEGVPDLYLEFRRQGQPVDPVPWLATHDGKVSG
jgi:septal ring factor EnvC (AmiA/AmiB activator)